MIKVFAQLSPWSHRVELLLKDGITGGYGKDVRFETVPDGTIVEPTFHISFEDAQALMDQLWNCGLRPTEGSGSAGALAATQRHLEDMRRLVFDGNKEVE